MFRQTNRHIVSWYPSLKRAALLHSLEKLRVLSKSVFGAIFSDSQLSQIRDTTAPEESFQK